MPQGATTPAPACRPKVPLPESSLSLAEATERQKLTFDDGLAAPVDSSAANGEGQLEVGGLVSKPDPVAVEKHRKHTIDVMKSLPKGLTFDGKSNWFAFKHKFTLYATELGWTSADCLHCLCWSLTGKTADFLAILLEQKQQLTYRGLLRKLELRFGTKELPATAQDLFQQATQGLQETLEDWADRVVSLATRAFRDLPEHYANRQSVVRFCQGLADRDAGHHVCMKEPRTIEDALNGENGTSMCTSRCLATVTMITRVQSMKTLLVYMLCRKGLTGELSRQSPLPSWHPFKVIRKV